MGEDSEVADKIIDFCSIPRSFQEIMDYLNYSDRKTVRNHIRPLLQQGRIAMTIPDKPKSSKQKYIAIK